MAAKLNVVITGATSRTATFLIRKLLAAGDKFHPPIGIVRSLSKAKSTFEDVWGQVESRFYEVPDVAVEESVDKLAEIFKGAETLVILTSTVGKMEDGKIILPENGHPERVDWIGQRNQIDAAKKAGISHIVMVSSMGVVQVTDPSIFFGYYVFKRKAIDYLLDSGIAYTIINPCMLIDGEEGKRKLVFSKSDQLRGKGYSDRYQVPRSDVAEVTFHTLIEPDAKNKAFDLLGELAEGPPGNDIPAALKSTTPGL